MRAFIENGADANAKVDRNAWLRCQPASRVTDYQDFVTPIQWARGVEVVNLLISAGADVNLESSRESPLAFQIEIGDADSVRAMVEAGANVEGGYYLRNGFTPLMMAVSKSNPAVVEVLLQGGAKVNGKNAFGQTALDNVDYFPAEAEPILPSSATEEERLRISAEMERMRLSALEVERLLLSAGGVSGEHPAD